MKTVLGLDVGKKRIGIAISTLGSGVVSPCKTVLRAGGTAEKEILLLIREKDISTVVVGMPYGEKGEETEQCEDVRGFCRRLERRTAVPLVFVDEYSSTYEAKEQLQRSGISEKRMKERGLIDTAAAVLILEDYLRLSKEGANRKYRE